MRKKKRNSADNDLASGKQAFQKKNLSREVQQTPVATEKRAPKWFYLVLILLPVMFLIILEVLLRSIDYGFNFDQWVDAGNGKYIINPDIGRKYFTNGNFIPNTIEDVFDQNKKTNSFRVFVLGESSAQGYPYNPMGSFSRYIRKRLELVYPNSIIEVVNLGMTAVNSYTMLDLLPGILEQKPDLILIYAGHNEYYGALGVGSIQSYGSSRTLTKLMLSLNELKITQLIRNSINWIISLFSSPPNDSSGTLMSRMAKDKKILLNSDIFNEGLEQFKENLSEILNLSKDKGVPVILGRLVSNLRDQKPFISVDTPGYKNADQVYAEAKKELNNNNFSKADSLFKLAKDLDALRFRAPEKINSIINDLSEEFNIPVVSIDSLFNSVSPEGITGDNLIVDHLHPNVEGYQLIGKAFYDCMKNEGYLPNKENEEIPYEKQDSLTRTNFVFTRLDSILGNYFIKILKTDWPYTKERKAISEFQEKDFINLFKPENFIDSLAMNRIQNKISWIDAHFAAATYYLKRDDLIEYLKYINVLVYQYPAFKDLDGVIRYFYEQNKIDLRDYTPKRNGLLAINIGNFDNAIKHLTEAYKANPKDLEVLYNLSLAHLQKKDYKISLSLVNEYLSYKPKEIHAIVLKEKIVIESKTN